MINMPLCFKYASYNAYNGKSVLIFIESLIQGAVFKCFPYSYPSKILMKVLEIQYKINTLMKVLTVCSVYTTGSKVIKLVFQVSSSSLIKIPQTHLCLRKWQKLNGKPKGGVCTQKL